MKSAEVFAPDLIVTADDGTEWALVVEAKFCLDDLTATESELKQYMLAMRCPLGLLVTPDRIRMYHDQYVSNDESSIELIGDFPAPPAISKSLASQDQANQPDHVFEDTVRGWLEMLIADE